MKPHSSQERPTKILTTPCDRHRALYNNCAETHLGSGVLSTFVFLLIALLVDCSCDIMYVATIMMQPNTKACVNEHVAKLFSV